MTSQTVLSSKLDLIAQDGFSLAASRQPGYVFRWHTHDCAMLLWPRAGVLEVAWETAQGGARERLVRGQALLLPPHVAHRTRSDSVIQQHGELYLAPALLQSCSTGGAFLLDGAAQAMLDALWMPALSARASPSLVQALIAQLTHRRVQGMALVSAPGVARRWLDLLRACVAAGQAMPSVAESALQLGVSMRTLQRACLEDVGQSPVTLRRTMLADVARSRLAAGESLAWVSTELGFANSGHLGRLLREVPISLEDLLETRGD